jgi:hypothetical protein
MSSESRQAPEEVGVAKSKLNNSTSVSTCLRVPLSYGGGIEASHGAHSGEDLGRGR